MNLIASILVDSRIAEADRHRPRRGHDQAIGTEAHKEVEEMLDGKVFLDLHVKVREDWRDDERLLDELGLVRREGRAARVGGLTATRTIR